MKRTVSSDALAVPRPHAGFIYCIMAAMLALVTAGCSSSTPSFSAAAPASAAPAAASSSITQPCSLLTQSEIETALGKGATMSSSLNQRIGKYECRVKPGTVSGIESVILLVNNADLWDGIKKAMLPPSSDAKPVPGLGDDAFVGRAVGYNVRKGNKYVQVFGPVTNNDAANDKATRYLAERAASRL